MHSYCQEHIVLRDIRRDMFDRSLKEMRHRRGQRHYSCKLSAWFHPVDLPAPDAFRSAGSAEVDPIQQVAYYSIRKERIEGVEVLVRLLRDLVAPDAPKNGKFQRSSPEMRTLHPEYRIPVALDTPMTIHASCSAETLFDLCYRACFKLSRFQCLNIADFPVAKDAGNHVCGGSDRVVKSHLGDGDAF